MGFQQIRNYIPVFYHRFLPPFFDKEIPAEAFASCKTCPMTAKSRGEMESETSGPFAPETKCCTFVPRVPNYFAGAVFSDPETMIGRDLLKKRISLQRGIFPQGIYPDKKYRLLYEFGRKHGFGRSSLLKCPYYLQGEFNCSLWKYRESICATWFCKYLGGEAGKAFWDEMRDLFKLVQEKLTEHAIRELGLSVIPPFGEDEQLTYEDLEELPMHPEEYRQRWQHWEGREEEFYTRCYEIINKLEVSSFNRLLGEEYTDQLKATEEKYHNMILIPDQLQLNPDYPFEEVVPGRYRICLKSCIDRNETVITYAFDLPFPVIVGFRDGKSTEQVLKKLSREYDIQLGKEVIIALYHHGILISGPTG